MNKVRLLIERIPFIAECVDADRFSARNLMIYDYELENKESVFSFRDGDKENNRLGVIELPEEYIGDKKAYDYAMDRLKLCMLSCDKEKGRIGEYGESVLTELLTPEVDTVSEVDEILSVEIALMGVWF